MPLLSYRSSRDMVSFLVYFCCVLNFFEGIELIEELKGVSIESLADMLMSEDDEKIWAATSVLQAFAASGEIIELRGKINSNAPR